MYDRIWTGFDLWRSLLAVSPDKADRTSNFFLEKPLRSAAGKSPKKQIVAGGILWLLVILISTGIPCLMLWAAEKIHPAVSFLLECFWCYQILAARSLSVESKKVYHALKHRMWRGKKSSSMIVGRDTKSLTEEGIAKAAVELWQKIHQTV